MKTKENICKNIINLLIISSFLAITMEGCYLFCLLKPKNSIEDFFEDIKKSILKNEEDFKQNISDNIDYSASENEVSFFPQSQ